MTKQKLTIIERHALTLEGYLDGPLSKHFFSEAFLDGLSDRRNEILQKLGKLVAGLLLLTTFLVFSDELRGSITVMGTNFVYSHALDTALAVLVALSIFSVYMTMLDQVIVERYMITIGAKLGVYNFPIFLAHRTAQHLGIAAMTPTAFGLKSKQGHERAFRLAFVIVLTVGGVLLIYPGITAGYFAIRAIWYHQSTLDFMLGLAGLIALTATAILVVLFSIKYEFDPADFRESDGEATDELREKLEREGDVKR